jgi:hypothetical protein
LRRHELINDVNDVFKQFMGYETRKTKLASPQWLFHIAVKAVANSHWETATNGHMPFRQESKVSYW